MRNQMKNQIKTKIIRVTLLSSGRSYRTISDAKHAARTARAISPGILACGIVIDRQRGERFWSENEIV